ncbi:MAG: hypothetical protein IKT33_01870, partial [Clostridia bacterium]|nr:hypothetical protein [Clostridia bacterium]
LSDDYISTYFKIEEAQNEILKDGYSKINAEITTRRLLSDMISNSENLINILMDSLNADIEEARSIGLSDNRIKELQKNNGLDIKGNELIILEKIADKYEVYQFMEARSVIQRGVNNSITDSNNHYLQVIKNKEKDFRKDSKIINKILEKNVLTIDPLFSNLEQSPVADEVVGKKVQICFDNLEFMTRTILVTDNIPASVGDYYTVMCLGLELVSERQMNLFINDLEKNGYNVNEIINRAQEVIFEHSVRKNDNEMNKIDINKKKTKFINKGIQILTKVKDTQEITK